MVYVPYVALIAAYALVYLPRFVVTREMKKLAGGYDNHDPRGQQHQLTGLGKRALAAHQNAFEAFAPFAAAILAALQRGARTDAIAWIAVGFVTVRSLYFYGYLADRARLRSGAWSLGVIATGTLLVLAVMG